MEKIKAFLLLLLISFFLFGCWSIDQSSTQENNARKYPEVDNGCLYFLSKELDQEGIYRICTGESKEIILAGRNIQEYALSQDSGLIAYIQLVENGNNAVMVFSQSVKKQRQLISCNDSVCENLVITPDGSGLFFSRTGLTTGLYQFDIDSEKVTLITSSFVDWTDISPDGNYLRFHETDSGLIRIISLDDYSLILSYPGDVDLVGSWSPDSMRFLMGERNVDGQLLISNYSEIFVGSGQKIQLFTIPMGSALFRPVYLQDDTFFALSRSGVRNNSRQVQIIDKAGNVIDTITDRFDFDHSSLKWNSKDKLLAYQRKDITRSDSLPEIVIWDSNTKTTTIIIENSIQPMWVY